MEQESEEMEDEQLLSGYDEDFANDIDDDFQCLICQLPLREPVLTRCGHRFCRQCLEKHFQRQESENQACTCPLERKKLDRQKDIFPDKATERKILSFTIKCPSEGCEWTGELRNKEGHLLSCNLKLVKCTNENCPETIKRKELQDHLNNTCQWKRVDCDHCGEQQPKCLFQEHVNSCPRKPVKCPNSCNGTFAQEEVKAHLDNDCPLTIVSCPYERMGCNTKLEKKRLDFHLDSTVRLHLDLACAKLDATEEEVKNFKEKTSNLEHKIEVLQKQFKERMDELEQVSRNRILKMEREIFKLKEESTPFLWKIEGFGEMLKNAKRGRNIEIESNNFFTGPKGYKLMAFIEPNGSFEGRNTHLSVYVCIMKGKYDALLPWPFQKKVTVTLIDQQSNDALRQNQVDEFTSTDLPGHRAFARPKSDGNCGYGFASFISHHDLFRRRYIVDDTLFLQIQVGPPSFDIPFLFY